MWRFRAAAVLVSALAEALVVTATPAASFTAALFTAALCTADLFTAAIFTVRQTARWIWVLRLGLGQGAVLWMVMMYSA